MVLVSGAKSDGGRQLTGGGRGLGVASRSRDEKNMVILSIGLVQQQECDESL